MNACVGFVILAYGKLGGIELGYGSDLDLVFVNNAGKELHRWREVRGQRGVLRPSRAIITSSPPPPRAVFRSGYPAAPERQVGLLTTSLDAFTRIPSATTPGPGSIRPWSVPGWR
ncbi:MAG: hypothetical protein U5L11_02305 [Arhodomonas sp.]|nr:hypothetical protein [Arhodomonas sp.]